MKDLIYWTGMVNAKPKEDNEDDIEKWWEHGIEELSEVKEYCIWR